MKSISIYALTRNQKIECLQKLERHLSGRKYFLKMREWELDSILRTGKTVGIANVRCVCVAFFLFFSDTKAG